MSEEDLNAAIAAAKDAKASPAWGRATKAAEESARRNPSGTFWTDRRRAIGYWPFYVDKNSSIDVVVLSSPHVFVVHKFIAGWNDAKGYSFPENWYGTCSQWRIPDDPAQEGFENVGKPCAACLALGEPRSITVLPIAIKREWTSKANGGNRTYAWQIKALIVDQSGAVNQLRDQAALQPHRDLKFCLLRISRSNNDRAPRIGDAFTVQRRFDEAMVKKQKDIADQYAEFSIAKAWAPLTDEQMLAALVLHKKFSDRKNDGQDYDARGMEKALRGELEAPEPRNAGGTDAGGSLDSLDDLESGGSAAADEPSFDDLAAEEPAKTEAAAKPAEKPAAAKPADRPKPPSSASPPADAGDPWA